MTDKNTIYSFDENKDQPPTQIIIVSKEPSIELEKPSEEVESKEIIETDMWEGFRMIKTKSLRERLSFVITENASRNFVKFEVAFSKKPLWRRMLFI